jgi:hypothetical protein
MSETMGGYNDKLDAVGERILEWADPYRSFRGYTEASRLATVVC